MNKWAVLIAVSVSVLVLPAFAFAEPDGARTRVVRSDDRGFEVEVTFAEPEFLLKKYDAGRPIHMVSIDGLGYLESEGKAMVPIKGLLVGLPATAEPTVEIVEQMERTLAGKFTLYPSPSYPPAEGQNGGCKNVCGGLFEVFRLDKLFYASRDLYPANTIERGTTGYLRDQRVMQVRIYPVRYSPAAGTIRFTERLLLRVDYGTTARVAARNARLSAVQQANEDVLRAALVNYDRAARWERPRGAGVTPMAIARPGFGAETKGAGDLKITVTEPGVYRLTYDDLQTAGFAPELRDPRTLRLLLRDQEVRIFVAGQDDGFFGPDDYIEFWGEPLRGRYSWANVYWLTFGGPAGLRMAALDGTPAGAPVPDAYLDTVHLEENNHWYPGIPTWPTAEFWEWELLRAPRSFSAAFDLADLSTLPRLATLRVRLAGKSAFAQSPDHHTKIYLNGVEVDDLYWDGQVEFTHEVAVPMVDLIEGQNVLTVTAPGDTGAFEDEVYLNWFEIDVWKNYRAAGDALTFAGEDAGAGEFHVGGFLSPDLSGYDVTDPLAPRRITGAEIQGGGGEYAFVFETETGPDARYAVVSPASALSPLAMSLDTVSALHSGGTGADYIILTDPAFDGPAGQIASLHANQGMRVAIVHTEDVYDEFNYGIPDPQAIRDFFAYAYANWAGDPLSYILLLGDSHPDYNDYLNFGKPDHIPPYLVDSPNMGATPSDVPYAQIVGADPYPDVYIGRIPAENLAYAQAQADKIVDYQGRAPEPWHKAATFVADNNYPAFETTTESLAAKLFGDITVSRLYLGFNDPQVIRNGLLGLLNAGQLLVAYVGHGNVETWAGESVFTSADALAVQNGAKAPFVMAFSCLSGYFPIIENRKALSEAFLVPPGGDGAIATLAPVGYTLRYDNDLFANRLFDGMFTQEIPELGRAIAEAEIDVVANLGAGREIIDLYHLLGDPATGLKIAYPAASATTGDYPSEDGEDAPADEPSGCGKQEAKVGKGCGA